MQSKLFVDASKLPVVVNDGDLSFTAIGLTRRGLEAYRSAAGISCREYLLAQLDTKSNEEGELVFDLATPLQRVLYNEAWDAMSEILPILIADPANLKPEEVLDLPEEFRAKCVAAMEELNPILKPQNTELSESEAEKKS